MLRATHRDTGHVYLVSESRFIDPYQFTIGGLIKFIGPRTLSGLLPAWAVSGPTVELMPDVIRGWKPYNGLLRISPRPDEVGYRYALALVRRLPCQCHAGDLRIERAVKITTDEHGKPIGAHVEYEEQE